LYISRCVTSIWVVSCIAIATISLLWASDTLP
jgi:hypothetical protein